MQRDPGDVRQVAMVMAVILLVLVAFSYWWEKRKAARRAATSKPISGKGAATAPVMIRGRFIVAFLAVLGLVWLLLARRPPHAARVARPPSALPGWMIVVLVLTPVALYLLWIGIKILRTYDRAMIRALEKANAGDREGALADIQEAIDARGMSGPRAYAKGIVHLLREEWDDATSMMQEASSRGYDRHTCEMTRVLIHYRSGRPEEALTMLRELYRQQPSNLILGCNLCQVLCDLRHPEEAARVLSRVEEERKKTRYIGKGGEQIDGQIEGCRTRLDGKKPEGFAGLDEL